MKVFSHVEKKIGPTNRPTDMSPFQVVSQSEKDRGKRSSFSGGAHLPFKSGFTKRELKSVLLETYPHECGRTLSPKILLIRESIRERISFPRRANSALSIPVPRYDDYGKGERGECGHARKQESFSRFEI